MKISEKFKRLFRRRPPTAEQLAARAEAEILREKRRDDRAKTAQSEMDSFGPF